VLLQSFQTSVRGLRCPLYDGGVSPEARRLLASGNVPGAFEIYHRLADLGSGKARCIIAYAHLLGGCVAPKNIEEARRIALSAATSEPGFSNYILGCIAMLESRWESSFEYFNLSRKAGFLPALCTAAKLSAQLYRTSARNLVHSETAFIQAIRSGYIPAFLDLASFYISGSQGFLKRLMGFLFFPFAVGAMYLGFRFAIFSPHIFYYHPSIPGLFKE
jgi:TPR repeat protein